MYPCMYVCMYFLLMQFQASDGTHRVLLIVCMYVHMYGCTHTCAYARMYVCTKVHTKIKMEIVYCTTKIKSTLFLAVQQLKQYAFSLSWY